MHQHDNLFGAIANFGALHAAFRKAIIGKRHKPGAAAFAAGLERNLLRLERELIARSWRPGHYLEIQVRDPKPRLVSAAPFRDRVVHHALCEVVAPLFDRGFIGAAAVSSRVEAWIAHASHADTWRLRHAIFHSGWFDPAGSAIARASRLKPGRPPVGASSAAVPGTTTTGTAAPATATGTTPEQQRRLPSGQHASMPEPAGLRSGRERRGWVQGRP